MFTWSLTGVYPNGLLGFVELALKFTHFLAIGRGIVFAKLLDFLVFLRELFLDLTDRVGGRIACRTALSAAGGRLSWLCVLLNLIAVVCLVFPDETRFVAEEGIRLMRGIAARGPQ